MAGAPRKWFPFKTIFGDFEWNDEGGIRDRHRHVLADTHWLFSQYSRAEILAREWLGKPPRHDCPWCGTRPKGRDGKYVGQISGGGPPYAVIHLNGNPLDCSRDNLKYSPVLSWAVVFHERMHVANAIRNDVPPRVNRQALTPGARHKRRALRRHVGDGDNWGPTSEDIPLLGINPGSTLPSNRNETEQRHNAL